MAARDDHDRRPRGNRLGFGAMRVTGEASGARRATTTRRWRCCGARSSSASTFIDTADSYGPNVSEELIAEALHPYPEGLVIATKGGMVRPGPGELGRATGGPSTCARRATAR